jgi:hypothetical protein
MSYFKKYLKYKNKYIQLKNNINGGGGDEILLECYDEGYEAIITKKNKIHKLKDISYPVVIFDFGGVMEHIDETLDLGVTAICLSYINKKGSTNYKQVKESINNRLKNKQIILGIIVMTDRMKGEIINRLGLNNSNVYFIDDSIRNINDSNRDAPLVKTINFIPKSNPKEKIIEEITNIKTKYGL